MATKFLHAGGDSTFDIDSNQGSAASWNTSGMQVATDFVHGGHQRSSNSSGSFANVTALQDTGSRISCYVYIATLPSATASIILALTAGGLVVARLRLTSSGTLQLWEASNQIGSNGSTLSTGQWYRISFAYTITSTTVNQFRVYVNGIQDISVSNATITNTSSSLFQIQGNSSSISLRFSDIYVDDSSSLVDTGDIWVTAKRPINDGGANTWTTRIGSGDSGYGSSHALEVNERPLSESNGWSSVATSNAIEEYAIEGVSGGDINISNASIVDYAGWVQAGSTGNETASIIVGGSNSNISLTEFSGGRMYAAVKGSTTYPSTGAAIGIQAPSSTAFTQRLYEAGIVIAFTYNLSISVADSISPSDAITVSKNAGFTISVGDSTAVSDSDTIGGSLTLQVNLDASIQGIRII